MPPTEPCFVHRGRLSSGMGIAHRLWLVGTKRVVNVGNDIPAELGKYLEITSPNHSYIYGDFTICPLEPDVPGRMRLVCVADANKLVVRDVAGQRRPVRIASTWPAEKR